MVVLFSVYSTLPLSALLSFALLRISRCLLFLPLVWLFHIWVHFSPCVRLLLFFLGILLPPNTSVLSGHPVLSLPSP